MPMTDKPLTAYDVLAAQPKRKHHGPGHGAPHAKSDIRLWLEENYAALDGKITSWKALTTSLARHGMTDENGNPPSVGAVQSAWNRIKKERAANAVKDEPRGRTFWAGRQRGS